MKRRIAVWASALLLCAHVSGARADNTAIRKELDSQYAKFNQSLVKKDMKAMFEMLTPDVTFKGKTGQTENREQLRQMMSQMISIMTISKATNKIGKLTLKSNMAIVEAMSKSEGKMKGSDGKLHSVAYTSKTRDFWTKTTSGWKIKKIEGISEQMLMDGKPFQQP